MDDNFNLKRHENVTTMIRYHNDKMIESFNRFLKFLVLIVGGVYFLLSLEHLSCALKTKAVAIVPWLILAVAISTLALIWSNYKSWHGFREREHDLSEGAIPKPVFPRSMSEQLIMTVVILAALIAYLWLQPFSGLAEACPTRACASVSYFSS